MNEMKAKEKCQQIVIGNVLHTDEQNHQEPWHSACRGFVSVRCKI